MRGHFRRLAICVLVLVVVGGCKGRAQKSQTVSSPVSESVAPELISAHTAGAISRLSNIRVVFTRDVASEEIVNQRLSDSPFRFDPKIEGEALWVNRRELQFLPEEELPQGQRYEATVDIKEAIGSDEDDVHFEFRVLEQTFEVWIEGLNSDDPERGDRQVLRGTIKTADLARAADIEKLLEIERGKWDIETNWRHDEAAHRYEFAVHGITRSQEEGSLQLVFKGKAIGASRDETRTITVPALTRFSVVQVQGVGTDQRYVEVRFSDPLDRRQNLEGLVRATGAGTLRFSVSGNTLQVYSSSPWPQETQVTLTPGIRSSVGTKLETQETYRVVMERLLPAVRFASQGAIVPTTAGLTVPIETANLRAIHVEALRVYEENLPQFLQVNELDGERELSRVGRPVWRRTVELDATPDKTDRWVRYGLDLSPLLKDNPKGLYRLQITFAPQYINYPCAEGSFQMTPWVPGWLDGEFVPLPPPPPLPQGVEEDDAWEQQVASGEGEEGSYWDYYEGGSYWELQQNRKNPCHLGYYRKFWDHNVTVARNILISDIGLIAKGGNDGSLQIIATDLQAATPLSGAKIRVLDYREQEIAAGQTDANGMLAIGPQGVRPFAVLAEASGQVGLLRLSNGRTLATSHFDVGGAQVSKGLKGFFYGERGVWRPGDDIYLTFILSDPEGKLPQEHPISFELSNPKGQLINRLVRKDSLGDFHVFRLRTLGDDPTGNYTARARVGGATFEQTLKVEMVVPNRLKIKFDFEEKEIRAPNLLLQTTLSSTWLHGAIARNLRAEVEMNLSPAPAKFAKYDGYTFDDFTRSYDPERTTIFDGSLDEKGEVLISATINPGMPPGMAKANFFTRVFEESGAASIDQHSIPVSPYTRYIGIKTPPGDKARGMLLTDMKHPLEIVAVDADGNPSDTEVEVALYKIQWRWWWEKGPESVPDYVGSSSYTPLLRDRVQLKGGKGVWEFEVKYPDWGRYLLVATDSRGEHRASKAVYIDWPGWAGRQQKDQPGGASVLTFVSDKSQYEVGEKITLTIPTPQQGRALVSLENGSQVVESWWVEPQAKETQVTFEARPEMAPNVYAHVTLLQPHLQTKNDLPIRIYGVIPLEIIDPGSRLSPVLEAPDEFSPASTGKVTVREEAGRPMTYTLAVVDEGLLGLTRYETPDPWHSFFRREALGVRTWDLFDQVAGAYGGTFERLLSIGGDEDGRAKEQAGKRANRFPPMVRFYGPFALPKGEKKEHQIEIPHYLGAVRVMAVAGGKRAYGKAEKSVFVRKPLMVLATLPRVLGPAEAVDLPVAVFALDPKHTSVLVEVSVAGPLELAGADKRTLSFGSPGDQIATFKLRVANKLGIGKVTVRASSAAEKIEHTIEIDIRHPGTRATDVLAGTVKAGENWSPSVTLVGLEGTNSARLEVTRVPPLNLGKNLDWLIRYPHGCVEQTVSAAAPQVHLVKLLDLQGERRADVDKHVNVAITKMQSFQTANGGFSYWGGDPNPHDWSTSYVGQFLLEAKLAGYVVPEGMIARWESYQRKAASSWTQSQQERGDLAQAYRLYTLALSGAPDLGAMNRMKEGAKLSNVAKWRLAAAYKLAGQEATARGLIEKLSPEVSPYSELSYTFGSDLRDKAMILETLLLLEAPHQAEPLMREISEQLNGRNWYSTQSLAFALIAMSRAVESGGGAENPQFDFAWNGAAAKAHKGTTPIVQIDLPLRTGDKPVFTFKNTGKSTLFPRLILTGLPPVGAETEASNNVRLLVEYATMEGKQLDVAHIEQGTDFIAKVTVTNPGFRGDYEEMALTQIVASGWEIRNERLEGTVKKYSKASAFDYRDVRDDRVYTYFPLKHNESKTFEVILNASYLGRFYLPPVQTEAMYDGTLNARTQGRWVEVVPPGWQG